MASVPVSIKTHNGHFGIYARFRNPKVNKDFDQLISFLVSNPTINQTQIGDLILRKEIERFRNKMHSIPGNDEVMLRRVALSAIDAGINQQQVQRIVVGRHISAEDLIIAGKKFLVRQVCYARPLHNSERGYSPFELDGSLLKTRDGVVVWQLLSWKGLSINRLVIVPKETYLENWGKGEKKTFYIPTSEAICRRGCARAIDFLKFTSWDWVKPTKPTF